ncbi:MAG: adenylate/guanylate cyclase domain-containing protein [Magnetovibrio sp.]|nr:adenylate/guanylate cyclase domain-containing protein [Magnetovibrio sp.]
MKITRRGVHLSAGLVLLTYVTCHLLNHSLGVVSIEFMERARRVFIDPWTTVPGTALLTAAILTHLGSALWVTYARRSLKMPAWQWTQLALGLCIPALLIEHAMATGGAAMRFGTNPTYAFVLAEFWVFTPWKGWMQAALLITVWGHACFGLHHWLKFRDWYQPWQPLWYAFALLVPAAALLGYVSAGLEVSRMAADPAWITQMIRDLRYPGDSMNRYVEMSTMIWLGVYGGLIALTFAGRYVRIAAERKRQGIRVQYPSGRRVLVPSGGTVLETSRAGGIPHASVCGGRGRCSTCRILVLAAADDAVNPPGDAENKVLTRLNLPNNVRLACQVRPTADITVEPLLPPDVSVKDAMQPGKFLHGREVEVAVMFADLRGFTKLSETRLPFDVVFMLNRYFKSMGTAITDAGGQVDKFIGDGIMALFGVDGDPDHAARAAIEAARRMADELNVMNEVLKNDLAEPLKLGIGIHMGPAIVGTMGYGDAAGVTAIGDTVNTASRLESLTKDAGCQLIISDAVTDRARCDLSGFPSTMVKVRGRQDELCVRHIPLGTDLPDCVIVDPD